MNKIKYILLSIAIISMASCDKHDSLDDDVITGPMAPQVYWEVSSSTVKSGSDVDFTCQYYLTGDGTIDHLETWYNIIKTEEKMVNCPWLSTFSYSITTSTESEERMKQCINTFAHNEEYWNDSIRAYTFNSTFPTSSTLSSVSWATPDTYDDDKVITYFGEGFKEHFKDSLYTLMKYEDFEKMLTGLGLVEDFKVYADSIFNENSNSYEYIFKGGEVPAEVKTIFDAITFDQLIFNSGKNNYEIQFNRTYYINANLHCVTTNNVHGTAIEKRIDLN